MKSKIKTFFRLWNENLIKNLGTSLLQAFCFVLLILVLVSCYVILVITDVFPVSVVLFILYALLFAILMLILLKLVKPSTLFNILYGVMLIASFVVGGILAVFTFSWLFIPIAVNFILCGFLFFTITIVFLGFLCVILDLIYTATQILKNNKLEKQETIKNNNK